MLSASEEQAKPRRAAKHNRDDVRELNNKARLLAIVRLVQRDGLLGHAWGYGFVIHRGVIAVFDHDRDDRILRMIDLLPPRIRRTLLACHESKGSVCLLWLGDPPAGFDEFGSVDVPDEQPGYGDSWSINESRAIRAEVLQ